MHSHANIRAVAASLILASITTGLARAQEEPWQSVTTSRDRYVTRFETRPKLAYTRESTYEQKAFVRRSWNPFKAATVEYRAVPTVKWVSRWQEQVVPITERQTQTETKLVRVPPQHSSSQIATKPLPWNPQRPPIAARDVNDRFGGVAQLDEDVPRVGLRLQPMVR